MTAIHVINALAWFANTVVWIGYAGSPFMGVASAAATLTACYLAWSAE